MTKKLLLLSVVFITCLAFPGYLAAQSQQVIIKGIVVDRDTKEGIPGVSIFLDGTAPRGIASTDGNGRYTISVPLQAGLIFRYIGYKEQKIKLKPDQVSLNIGLAVSSSAMDEVVVRGYQKRSKETSTGASFTVSGKEIQDIPVSNAEQLLQGRVAGLNVQVNTGAPGYRGSIAIRGISGMDISGSGTSSFLNPTSPLYVIDGVPVEADDAGGFTYGFNSAGPGVSPLSLIPPEDIESIEVLKDAQATSLYGSRGAFGVILITTRRGNSVIPRVRYTANFFANNSPKLRETLGGISERQAKINEILATGTYSDIQRIASTPMLADSLSPYFNNSTDWQDVFYRTTYNTSHNLNIDGGNDKFNYKTNFGYYGENGIIENTGFKRYTLTTNMNYKPNERFSVFINLTGGIGKQNKGDGQGIFQTGVGNNAAASTLLPGPSLFQTSGDVLKSLAIKNDNLTKNLRTNVDVGYVLFPGFRVSTSGSYDYAVGVEETFTPAAANSLYSGVYSYNDRNSTLYNRSGFTYSKSLGNGDHNFFLNTFSEVYMKRFQASFIIQQRTPNDQFQGPLGASSYYSRGGGVLGNYNKEHTVSFASGFSYDYKKKYVLDLTYRLDASSVSGFDNPFSKNPSIGFRWNFNKENFLADIKWLTFADMRLSWGRNIQPTGNIYSLYGTYTPTGNYVGVPRIGLNYGTLPNSVLKPSTNTTYNFGVDVDLFDSKVGLIFDTYLKRVTNLSRSVDLSTMAGFSNVSSNDAGLVDYGYELTVSVRPLSKSSPVNWSLSVNGAINHDILTRLPGNVNQIVQNGAAVGDPATVLRVGRNTLSNFLLKNNGVYGSNSSVPVDPGTGFLYRTDASATAFFQAGDPIWEDTDGDYVLTEKDRQVLGNSQPIVTGGLSSYIAYKNFSLNISGSFTMKRDIINDALASRLRLVNNPFGDRVYLPLSDLNYYSPGAVNATYPNPFDYTRTGTINPFRSNQSIFQEDGTYFKLNSLSLGYTLNKEFTKSLGINVLRFYLSSNNVFTLSSYSGPNPENVTALGYDASGGYPVARTYNLGINVEF
ncbi:MAG TPA: SusC/RagA family TonB-linked outer membrane protein [Pedobacter sp.]|uniref:SusC/RagA family TonB-linked outer membrane protein n=1 Tax=Pedobacter sp. TaxID=1411316 RepID=UPI002B65F2AB|nr:SusC/RagA family TonB-linked outer membrane protein [Pedobacter sp.]HMI02810.1 SusC/RagA family TonB-linked outer membrane protein [Pedobacter sp.]